MVNLNGDSYRDFVGKDRAYLEKLLVFFKGRPDIAYLIFEGYRERRQAERPDYLQNEVPF